MNLVQHLVGSHIHHTQRRARCQIGKLSIQTGQRIVRCALHWDVLDDLAAHSIHHHPGVVLPTPPARRHIQRLSIRRHRHPIAPGIVDLLPDNLVAEQIHADQRFAGRADVQPLGDRIGADAAHATLERGHIDPPHELMLVLNVIYKESSSRPPTLGPIRRGEVKQVLFLCPARQRTPNEQQQYASPMRHFAHNDLC